MRDRHLRARLLLSAAPLIGCTPSPDRPPGSPEAHIPPETSAPRPPTTGATATAAINALGPASPGPRAWVVGRQICAVARHTESRTQPAPGPPFTDCGGWPEFRVVSDEVRSLPCGPCGFAFDASSTHKAREQRPDACCYETRSPPLGRPLHIASGRRQAPLRPRAGWS